MTNTGPIFDPTDINTLWQDEARTIPVTKDGDIVRGVSDASGKGMHGTITGEGGVYRIDENGEGYVELDIKSEVNMPENSMAVIDSLTATPVDELELVEDDEPAELEDGCLKEQVTVSRQMVGRTQGKSVSLSREEMLMLMSEGFGTNNYPTWQYVGGDHDGSSMTAIRHRDTKPKQSKSAIRKQRKVRKAARKATRRGK